RGFGSAFSSRARPRSRLVSPAIAEGTTTTWWPSFTKRAMRFATSRILSGEPIEVPPYFWTIRDKGWNRAKGRILSEAASIPNENASPPPDSCPGRARGGRPRERRGVVLRGAAGRAGRARRLRQPGQPRREPDRPPRPALRGPPLRPGGALRPRPRAHARGLQPARGGAAGRPALSRRAGHAVRAARTWREARCVREVRA